MKVSLTIQSLNDWSKKFFRAFEVDFPATHKFANLSRRKLLATHAEIPPWEILSITMSTYYHALIQLKSAKSSNLAEWTDF